MIRGRKRNAGSETRPYVASGVLAIYAQAKKDVEYAEKKVTMEKASFHKQEMTISQTRNGFPKNLSFLNQFP